jgi:hypothetical protein
MASQIRRGIFLRGDGSITLRELQQFLSELFRLVQHHIMAARHGESLPTLCFRLLVERWEWRGSPTVRQNESDILNPVDCPRQMDGLLKGGQRLRGALSVHPIAIFGIDV